MADNVTLDPGAGGAVIAADDVSSVFFQKVKLDGGGDGVSVPIVAGGGTESSALRVTIASDSTGVLSVDDNGSTLSIDDGAGSITVDGSVSLAAAVPAGTNNIGDVDVLTVPADPFGANADAAVAAGAAGSIQAKLRRATSDIDAIKTAVEILDNAIAGSEIQADVITLPSIPAGNNNIGDVDIASIAAGNNNIGDVDIASIAAGTNSIGNVGIVPRTSGGVTPVRILTVDETEEQIKATAGQLFGWWVYNDNATEVYLKFYDATTASVVVGTTTPVMTVGVPAGSAANILSPIGIAFATAITVAATTAAADADTGAPTTDVVGSFFYT